MHTPLVCGRAGSMGDNDACLGQLFINLQRHASVLFPKQGGGVCRMVLTAKREEKEDK